MRRAESFAIRHKVPRVIPWVLALVGCAAIASPGPGESGDLAAALDRAIERPEARLAVRLQVICPAEAPGRALIVYGRGLGIWSDRRQFSLTQEEVVEILERLRGGGFAAMVAVSGEPARREGEPAIQATELVCRIDLLTEGRRDELSSRRRDPDRPALRRLARDLLDVGAALAREGVEADSLADGLDKVAAGVLEPETLTVHLRRLPIAAAGDEADPGWLLRLDGWWATARSQVPGEPVSGALVLELRRSEVEELARTLSDRGVAVWPQVLRSRAHTELSIAVLNRSRSLQGRPSTRPSERPGTDAQAGFDEVVASLAELYERVVSAGRPATSAEGGSPPGRFRSNGRRLPR